MIRKVYRCPPFTGNLRDSSLILRFNTILKDMGQLQDLINPMS